VKFRQATEDDHPLMRDTVPHTDLRSISEAWVTNNEDGQRYWIVVLPYALGQIRLQTWLERTRGEYFPAIFHHL
jgi:hypothetical protein